MCQISRLLTLKITTGMPKCHNRFLFNYADILWAAMHRDHRDFNLNSVQLSFKNIQSIFHELSAGQVRQNCRATLVIPPGTSVATIVTICCNHRDSEYFLHRISIKLGSTATSTVITRLLPLTNYISGTENETQRALLGHTNGNIEMRSPWAAAMLTMVAAATIVRFSPVILYCANWVKIFWNPYKSNKHEIPHCIGSHQSG